MPETAARMTDSPQYKEKIARWEAFWSLEDIGRPLWILPRAPILLSRQLEPSPLLYQEKERQFDAEIKMMNLIEAMDVGDDFIPCLQPYGGVTVFASAFGCEVDFPEHTQPWAHAVIGPDDPPEKVYELPTPKVTDGQLGNMLAFTDYFVAQTEGRYPVALTDLQGPLDTAYLVWDSCSFMLAMYTNPKEVHHLMRQVTDLIIAFVKEQRSRVPEFVPCHFPPLWLPDGRGVSISDDGLAVISAKLYEEFALPYVNELSEEFGGMMIHSCGDFRHQLGNLEKVHNLRGVNFGATETPFEAVWERLGGKTCIIPHNSGIDGGVATFKGNKGFMEHVLSTRTHDRGLCLMVAPDDLEAGIPAIMDTIEQAKETFAADKARRTTGG